MAYLLIYRSKRFSLLIGEYETYGEALLAMLKGRRWLELHNIYNVVRFEISEVSYD